jgi:predicted DCC family thiol-disulfide oxidoreductase YuxK
LNSASDTYPSSGKSRTRKEKGRWFQPMVMERYVLVYDKDCGNCTRFKRIVNRLDAYRRLDYLSLIEADESGMLDPVPGSRRHRSFHLIYPGGTIISGSAAIPELISLLPSGGAASFLIRRAPGGRTIVNLIYSMFSRLHDTGSCSYPDDSAAREDEVGEILPQERAGLGAVGRGMMV